ncbi:MAG TPA: hypothetical protein VK627_02110 [Edaphobacter sp.]|nr:hypothetical protein [Edaphobacter sp.]
MDAAHMVLSGMWLQESDALSSGNTRLLMIFIGILACAMLIQAIAVVIVAVGAAKARKQMLGFADEFRSKAMPMFETVAPMMQEARDLFHDASPKVKIITENLVETSHLVRNKAQEFDATVTDVNVKTRAQVARVDSMVTSVLATTSEIANSIQHGIRTPVREVSGLVQGLKAGLDVLVGRAKGFGSYSRKNGEAEISHDVSRDRGPGW